ncbi:alpha amylase N-terminal ig-like domain-containing protein [Acetohalobium arabaticum]|uniref:Alpha amylase catalytic region n=1 Tax=Acetohalobium arabaticum (strain ATCC 49924 / DSM 5501 / Z-7288) TaxID=574087 RepID=D9QVV4_ACEAZ|nr:alpha amylase N-terminal ig-like domain-containing protein [Acetohalobium arabaticum]ADL12363.1 alpha amylase catalytic region [Acetohalobium arabaticum DSM 5501]
MAESFEVTFTYKPVISVDSVNLIGDFNDWDLDRTPMADENGDGTYEVTLELEAGEYQYKFVVDDDKWQKPPEADYYVDDGFGEKNGVIIVGDEVPLRVSVKGNGVIDFETLRHNNSDVKFANPLSRDRISIRFQTRRNDVEEVTLCYNDGQKQRIQLENFATYEEFDFYKAIIDLENPYFEYYFEVKDGDKIIWYDKEGIKEADNGKLTDLTSFQYNLSEVDIFRTPGWVKDAIFYQIFPDRFYNGCKENDPEKIEVYKDEDTRCDAVIPDWEKGVPPNPPVLTEETEFYDNKNEIHPEAGYYVFYGGDLQGVEQKIPYLKRLGVNAVYLNPIFKGTANHRYNTAGYELVDDTLAIKGDLEASEEYVIKLIEKLHRYGFKVIFDAVFNHTGYEHWAFQDIIEHGKDSKYVDWYNIHSFPIVPLYKQNKENPPNYDCWWGFGHLPELNVKNPEVRDYIFQVTEKWMDPKGNGDLSAGIDGWRLDVPNEVKEVVPNFWQDWRESVMEINPEAYIVGEIWDNASDYLQGDEFDGVMNYRFRDAALRFLGLNEIKGDEFAAELSKMYFQYPEQANYSMLNLIDSHDTSRYLTVIDEDKERMKLTVLFQMTYLGAPMVYYGDEIGMKGEDGPDCRRTMIWKDRGYTKPDYDLFNHYQRLIKIRKQQPALRRGNIRGIDIAYDQVDGFKRSYGDQQLLVLLNAGKEMIDLEVEVDAADGKYRELYQNRIVSVDNGRLHLKLEGITGAIIKLS